MPPSFSIHHFAATLQCCFVHAAAFAVLGLILVYIRQESANSLKRLVLIMVFVLGQHSSLAQNVLVCSVVVLLLLQVVLALAA